MKSRGRPAERMDALRALRVDASSKAPASSSAPGASPGELQALRKAGWVLVAEAEARRVGGRIARVFLEDGSHVLLSDGALTVKFRDDVSRERAQQILARAGLIGRPTPLARNAFEARVQEPESVDAVDVARSLEAEPEVEFAEPSFIETLGHR